MNRTFFIFRIITTEIFSPAMSHSQKTSPSNQNHSLLIGSLTGFITGVTLQPLEIIKTNLMINPLKSVKRSKNPLMSTILITKEIFKHEGLLGFWRGMVPALIKLIASSGLYFSMLSKLEVAIEKARRTGENSQHFLSSSLARMLSGILTNPIQVIRTRFEVLGFAQYKNTFEAIGKIYNQEGMKGFLTGIVPTALRDAPFAGIYFSIYVRMKRRLEEKRKNMSLAGKSFVSGMVAGVIATLLTNPFDLIRARMQYGYFIKDEGHRYKNVRDGIEKIYRNEGLNGFMKGLLPRLLRKPLSNSITFVVYEAFHKVINKEEAF